MIKFLAILAVTQSVLACAWCLTIHSDFNKLLNILRDISKK